jgi:hypothetical protein
MKPPWKACSEIDRQAMIDFVVGELIAEDMQGEELMARWGGKMDA